MFLAGALEFSTFGKASRLAEEVVSTEKFLTIKNSEILLPTPKVTNSKLQNIINDLYKGTTNPMRIGTGTTADAVRNELLTNQPTKGHFHIQKAEDYSRALKNWQLNNPDAAYTEQLIAQSLLDDLQNALRINK